MRRQIQKFVEFSRKLIIALDHRLDWDGTIGFSVEIKLFDYGMLCRSNHILTS